ncbi:YqaA family protein [Seleniivibrio sp.]|uniref:YqaA family protein n=1 Tax=Seleniivibrio sp. TaxID=2898801 RepID=UPI0025F29474|nr:YqaA family protein [Seleniivibrio sp.]MCD8553270.1 DedA family protein [Seleniivibrio sp.]
MHEWLLQYGYFSMFLLAFLASTALPLASEWLLVALVIKGLNPVLLLTCAVSGNYLGACTTYAIGFYGSDYAIRKILKISDESRVKAERIYNKYGAISLLFSWVPVIGDPLCLVGGLFKMHFIKYSVLVLIGKFIRYAATVWLTLKGTETFIQ